MSVIKGDISTDFSKLKDESLLDLAKDYGNENINGVNTPLEAANNPLRVIELADFLAMDFPPRELILEPWLPTSGLCMIHARPGVGKTHVALGVAYAVASGGEFLGWKADRPRGVLYIDGEMPARTLQERLNHISLANGNVTLPAKLLLVTPDMQGFLGMPDLATLGGQAQINGLITDEVELIIIDNLSCLVKTGQENESGSWQPIQSWALNLRAKGKSVLFIHHAGKGGTQRGSSKKEDVLDTVICLKRPEDYKQDQGSRFTVTFEKARSFYGDEAKPFEAQLLTNEQAQQVWATQSLEENNYQKVINMLNDGMEQKDITIELGINKSNVSRYAARARREGLIKERES